ncbi:hypothetical protein SpCBS45565_g04419 [Spizellomyces sp. 'palustris']|nr:hypothetical protein SpCBS45565_g04419 [Spizellomyces sp. 'palustris']
MQSLSDYPFPLLLLILEYLPAPSLALLSQTSHFFYRLASSQTYWKRLCLTDWPWFFYDGTCEHSIPLLGVPDPVQCVVEGKERKSGDEHVCTFPHKVLAHAQFFLPNDYKEAYRLIAGGRYSGCLQVLGSLVDRQMSAFVGIVTYDKRSQEFCISYNPLIISQWRRGRKIRLLDRPMEETEEFSHLPEFVDERIPISERHRFRRIPEDLLEWDSRELNFREFFTTLRPDGRPGFEVGDEVEIQWRFGTREQWAWWRGYVSRISASGDGEDGMEEEEGITVAFPHYPTHSPWYSVVVGVHGSQEPNPRDTGDLGYVGGIRKVEQDRIVEALQAGFANLQLDGQDVLGGVEEGEQGDGENIAV